MQARAQSQLLGQLLPMVAQLSSAQARCDALARDLGRGRRIRPGDAAARCARARRRCLGQS